MPCVNFPRDPGIASAVTVDRTLKLLQKSRVANLRSVFLLQVIKRGSNVFITE